MWAGFACCVAPQRGSQATERELDEILGQDQPVVEVQTPRESRLRIPEVLVDFDLPIVAYRKQREKRLLPAPGAAAHPVVSSDEAPPEAPDDPTAPDDSDAAA